MYCQYDAHSHLQKNLKKESLHVQGTITNTINYGNVNGYEATGGIVGMNSGYGKNKRTPGGYYAANSCM